MSRVVGNYTLLAPVGQGGLGEVWRAHHAALGREVAVKLIRPGTLGGTSEQERVVLRRFEREARLAAALRSPHTVQLFDFGMSEAGEFYQVMELLEGIDLQGLVERFGPVEPARVVVLLRQACDALAEAHAMGFIHRDLKPANLYLSRLGAQADFLKVLDFGLARTAAGVEAQDSLVTLAGTVPGSPAYLAPEIIRGLEAPTDRADVYALGCVAWWLITGRLVFEARAPIEMVVAHLEREPPSLEGLTPGVNPALAEVIRACLAKDPAARPSVRELSRQLAATGLAAGWTEERAHAWWEAELPVAARVPLSLGAPFERRPAVSVAATASPASSPLPPLADLPVMPLPALKEQVYTRLREHFVQSRIDLNDFERRLAVARAAASPDAVAEAVKGLPGPPSAPLPQTLVAPESSMIPAPPVGLVRGAEGPAWQSIVGVLGTLVRRGEWHPAAHTRVVAVFGGAALDLREALLEPGMTELRCVAVMGTITLTVPPDLYVEVAGVGIMGGFDARRMKARRPSDDRPWVRVTGVAVFGGVRVMVKPRVGTGPGLGEIAARGAEVIQTIADELGDAITRGRKRSRRRRGPPGGQGE